MVIYQSCDFLFIIRLVKLWICLGRVIGPECLGQRGWRRIKGHRKIQIK